MNLLNNLNNRFKKPKPKQNSIYVRHWSGSLAGAPDSCKFTLNLRRITPGEELSLSGMKPGSEKVEYYRQLSGGPPQIWELLANKYPTHCLYFSYTVDNPSGLANRVLLGDNFSFAANGYDSESVAKSCYSFILRLAHEIPDRNLIMFSKLSQFTWAAALYKRYGGVVGLDYKTK